jgi:4-hydroxy-3-polyprenylbenzoate decarboxylase
MPTPTFRELIATLEKKGRLKRITRPVDPAWEAGCLVKWLYQAVPDERRFGFLFENVKGSKIPLAVGLIGSSTDAYATALGVPPDEINATWVAALRKPLAPVSTATASSQEIVQRGEDARLSDLPIPVWTPGKDPGPYVTSLVITRNANTGIQNVGVYRTQVRDPHHLIVNLSPGRQGTMSAASYTDQNRPAPIAWVIGAEPALALSAVANLPYGVDECEIAGALAERPIELVKAKTIDLMVPANAEIIIEGEVLCGQMEREGPFGEFAGYMGHIGPRPLVRVTAITHRCDPIYYGFSSQMPPSESTVMQSLTNAGVILKVLRHDLGEIAVRDVFVDLTFGGLLGHGIVAMKPRYPGHGKRVGRLVADMTPLKRVTVVDDDVDIRDPSHIEWALNARFDPVKDSVIIDDVNFGNIDPSVTQINGRPGPGSKLVIDATEKTSPGTFSLPTKDHMMRAQALWSELGLPALDVPKRLRLRLDRP